MVTADDYSLICWPRGARTPSKDPGEHRKCEQQLTDYSDPAKQYDYCGCDCHYDASKPGFVEHTAGRYTTRDIH